MNKTINVTVKRFGRNIKQTLVSNSKAHYSATGSNPRLNTRYSLRKAVIHFR